MRWLPVGGLVTVSVLPLVIAASAVRHELRADFRPMRSVPAIPAVLEADGMQNVSFEARGATIRGWFAPSSNGAAVVFAHGADADRAQLADEAHLLAKHGYGVLLFDWPGHGESGGSVTWDSNERATLESALDLVSRSRGVDPTHIGVFAFSMGTMIAIQVAARDARVASLVVAGAFADADDEIRHGFRHWGVLSQWPALWTAHFLGWKPNRLRPRDVVADISPRPLMVIAGTADVVVPADQSRALFNAASEPKSWWLIDGATHQHYAEASGPSYEAKLVGFFDSTLLRKNMSPPANGERPAGARMGEAGK
jgi:pimeloyl-ACP methyl ester carboxylesterase